MINILRFGNNESSNTTNGQASNRISSINNNNNNSKQPLKQPCPLYEGKDINHIPTV